MRKHVTRIMLSRLTFCLRLAASDSSRKIPMNDPEHGADRRNVKRCWEAKFAPLVDPVAFYPTFFERWNPLKETSMAGLSNERAYAVSFNQHRSKCGFWSFLMMQHLHLRKCPMGLEY